MKKLCGALKAKYRLVYPNNPKGRNIVKLLAEAIVSRLSRLSNKVSVLHIRYAKTTRHLHVDGPAASRDP